MRMAQEVDAVSRMAHANMPYIHSQGSEAGRPVEIFMPVYEGSLRDRVKQAARTDPTGTVGDPAGRVAPWVGSMLTQVLAALEHIHGRDFIHRDIKPNNILFRGDDWVLSDFGVAKPRLESSASSGTIRADTIMGTELYAPPEYFTHSPQTAAEPRQRKLPVTATRDTQQQPTSLYDLILKTKPKPSSSERRSLALVIATQVRSLHTHFQVSHPALQTHSFVFLTKAGSASFPVSAPATAPNNTTDLIKFIDAASPELALARPYVLGWGGGTGMPASVLPVPLTVEDMFQHPEYRALPAGEKPTESPWYNQAWALMMVLSEIADWWPIVAGPFHSEAELREATLKRMHLVTNDSWKNDNTAKVMQIGFQPLEASVGVLQQRDHWDIKSYYDRLCHELALL
ncbi:hypothetical protein SCUCBS95973_008835 [Sporothrix curviconia]|uniref:non-specific serine/threonine protein kinase n=1 Tax=Sporothrix curviconia TaxID=1260050 RepID=A0ABP0CQ86_9PEZI